MAFTKKTWVDRMVEFAGRRKLTNVSNSSSVVYDVERAEGVVQQEGTAFSAANMNDLETRIANAITATDNSVTTLNKNMGGVKFGVTADGKPGYKKDGADTVYPFHEDFSSLAQCEFLYGTLSKKLSITFSQKYEYALLVITGADTTNIIGQTLTGGGSCVLLPAARKNGKNICNVCILHDVSKGGTILLTSSVESRFNYAIYC